MVIKIDESIKGIIKVLIHLFIEIYLFIMVLDNKKQHFTFLIDHNKI
jgi:hypothetical protein